MFREPSSEQKDACSYTSEISELSGSPYRRSSRKHKSSTSSHRSGSNNFYSNTNDLEYSGYDASQGVIGIDRPSYESNKVGAHDFSHVFHKQHSVNGFTMSSPTLSLSTKSSSSNTPTSRSLLLSPLTQLQTLQEYDSDDDSDLGTYEEQEEDDYDKQQKEKMGNYMREHHLRVRQQEEIYSQPNINRFVHRHTKNKYESNADSPYERRISISGVPNPKVIHPPVSRTTRDIIQLETSTTIKIFILVIQPSTKRFELIQVIYPYESTTIGDILELIPSNCTETSLGDQVHIGLCRPNHSSEEYSQYLTNLSMKASGHRHDSFCAHIEVGEILVAIPEGYHAKDCQGIAKHIFKNPKMVKLLSKSDPLSLKKKKKKRSSSSSRRRSTSSSRSHLKPTIASNTILGIACRRSLGGDGSPYPTISDDLKLDNDDEESTTSSNPDNIPNEPTFSRSNQQSIDIDSNKISNSLYSVHSKVITPSNRSRNRKSIDELSLESSSPSPIEPPTPNQSSSTSYLYSPLSSFETINMIKALSALDVKEGDCKTTKRIPVQETKQDDDNVKEQAPTKTSTSSPKKSKSFLFGSGTTKISSKLKMSLNIAKSVRSKNNTSDASFTLDGIL